MIGKGTSKVRFTTWITSERMLWVVFILLPVVWALAGLADRWLP